MEDAEGGLVQNHYWNLGSKLLCTIISDNPLI
jgi:hypothetical protein